MKATPIIDITRTGVGLLVTTTPETLDQWEKLQC